MKYHMNVKGVFTATIPFTFAAPSAPFHRCIATQSFRGPTPDADEAGFRVFL